MSSQIVSADDVIGVGVRGLEDTCVGEVKTLMLDKKSGQVSYVVLSYGGVLGIGDKLFALPWEMFSYDESFNGFRIPVNEEKLKNSTGFDKDNWPDMSDANWSRDIHEYYGLRNKNLPEE